MKKKHMKRANGTGTVKYLGKGRRKPYAPMITVGTELYYDDEGNEKTRCKTEYLGYYATRQEAELVLAKYVQDSSDPALLNMTMTDLYNLFVEDRIGDVSESSIRAYRTGFNHFSSIANMKLHRLSKNDFKRIYDGMKDSPSKIAMHAFANTMFNWGVKNHLIRKNPVEEFVVKKPPTKKQRNIFTPEEILALWDVYYNEPASQNIKDIVRITLIQIYTGARIGEILSIKKEDVQEDFLHIPGTKTKNADRVIPIREEIKPLLFFSPNGYLMESVQGKECTVIIFASKYYPKLLDYMGDRIDQSHTSHDARHTFISYADDSDLSPNAIKKIVGHAGSGVTEKVYTHKTLTMLQREISKITFPVYQTRTIPD